MSLAELASVPLFRGIDEAGLGRLTRSSTVSHLEHGAVAALRGEPASALLVVERGGLSAVHDSVDGRRVRLGEFRAPCAVDKVALLDTRTYTATWEAIGATRIRYVPRRLVLTLIGDVDTVRQHVLAHLAAEVRRHQDERVRATLADASTRLAAWLADQVGAHGIRVELPHGQAGLGESIGASRVTTNRCLQELARLAVIRVDRRAVTVLAPEVLALMATGQTASQTAAS